jgi:hypothetical protein
MMFNSVTQQQTRAAAAASEWVASRNPTHALTVTYPVVKPPHGQVQRIDASTGQSSLLASGSTSFTNCPTPSWASSTEHSVPRHLRLLSAMVDRKLFGCRFRDRLLKDRSHFFAYLTGLEQGAMMHVHMVWSLTPDKFNTFETLFADGERATPWQKIVPAGTHKLELLYDADGWIGYSARQSDWNVTILSSELIPEKEMGSLPL